MDQTLQNDRVPSRKMALGATIGEHVISIHNLPMPFLATLPNAAVKCRLGRFGRLLREIDWSSHVFAPLIRRERWSVSRPPTPWAKQLPVINIVYSRSWLNDTKFRVACGRCVRFPT